jgi:hypothetical protein
MAATREEISKWFDRGLESNHIYMLVVCDTFDWDDYPVFTNSDEECISKYNRPGDMQKVMEVYDLRQDKQEQMNERRCFRLPTIVD